ncbi:hypothetical protein C0J45_7757 [Silurus meridionalis]|nr:hypothetical protein C0J45_7757 [Silurus meridionalis]
MSQMTGLDCIFHGITKKSSFFLLNSGDSTADPIETLSTQKVVDEGYNVTLSCSYKKFSGAVNNLFWYRHYPKAYPKFLLYIDPFGGDSMANSIKPQFTYEVVDEGDKVTLSCSYEILTDDSLNWAEQLVFWWSVSADVVVVTMLLYHGVTGSFADKIGSTDKDANIISKETDTVTLKCSYETSSERIWLYWYKQYPNSTPQFLLYKGARSASNECKPTDTRLESKTTRDSTELTIRGLKLSDSALYHCALRDVAQ